MRHDWVFDVLTDLRSYALRNGLPRLAEQADQTLRTAHEEVAAQAQALALALALAATETDEKPPRS